MSPDDRQSQIIDAARRVMGDFGVRRATMADVAKAAGLSRQTVYEYFPSREALVQAALMAGARDVVARGVTRADERGGSRQKRLAVLIEVALEFFRASPLWATAPKRAELSGFVALEGGVFLGAGTAAIEDALSQWWPEVDQERLARAADTLARSLVSHGLAPEASRPADIGVGLAELLARGLD